jgi:hypothetical protein
VVRTTSPVALSLIINVSITRLLKIARVGNGNNR